MVLVLERVQQSDQPRGLDSSKDIPLHQDVLHLVHLCQCTLSHLFEGADLVGIGFASEVDGTVAALTDLRNDTELLYSKLGSSLTEHNSLASAVRRELFGIFGSGDLNVRAELGASGIIPVARQCLP